MEIISIIILFVISQVYLEKRGLVRWLQETKLPMLLLLSVLVIAGVILLIGWFKGSGMLIAGVTVVMSTVITYRFREKFSELEKGK